MDEKFQTVAEFDNIYEAFRLARKGSFWKDSIITYDISRLENTVKISRSLKAHTYKLKGHYNSGKRA